MQNRQVAVGQPGGTPAVATQQLNATITSQGRRVAQARAARLILLQCLLEGMAIRVIREPDIELDEIEPALRQLTDPLLGS